MSSNESSYGIISKAPFRISFGGGGTDVPPYCWEHGGAVISTTINKYAHVSLKPTHIKRITIHAVDLNVKKSFKVGRLKYGDELDLIKATINEFEFNTGFELVTNADMPPGSGMGTSSSMSVALIGCLADFAAKSMDKDTIAKLAYHIEREELRQKGGYQDQYAAVFGGLNFIEFFKRKVIVNSLKLKPEILKEFQNHLLLLFTGKSRFSGEIHEDMARRYAEKKTNQLEILHRLKEIAKEMKNRLLGGDLKGFGELLHEGWSEKKKLSGRITSPKIEALYERARHKGAAGGKILGAGGGGHLLIFCRPERRTAILNELIKYGVVEIPFRFEPRGLQVWRA